MKQSIGFENLQIIYLTYSKNALNDILPRYDNVICIEVNSNDAFEGKLFNVGINHAISDYLIFLNPSDILKDNACELLYKNIIDNEFDIISGVQKIDNNKPFNFSLNIEAIEEDLTIITNSYISNKLFKKSFVNNYNILFKENIPNPQTVFLLNTLLKTPEIGFINEIIVKHEPNNLEPSKNTVKGLINFYFELFYIFNSMKKIDIFIEHVLYNELELIIQKCSKEKLAINDFLEFLKYSKPLFDLCIQHNYNNKLFEFISQQKYEEVLWSIYGKQTPKQNEIKIAALCDSKTFDSFKFECNLINLDHENWQKELKKFKPHLFLVSSKHLKNSNEPLLNLILNYCHENNITTIFLENEDLEFNILSLKFDYIFTNFNKNVPDYQKKGHENAYYLMFAVQPRLFNPINSTPRLKNSIMYYGSWNSENQKCCRLMSETFDKMISSNYNLKIYDEDSITNLKNSNFPRTYKYYLDTLEDKSQIAELFKEFERGLLINEKDYLTNSKIFELMASNTLVFSNFSKEIFNLFKDDVYYIDTDNNFDNENSEKIKNRNIHNILENHTFTNRLKQILDTINFNYIPIINHVVLFYELYNLNDLDMIYNHFYSINYPYKEIKIITTEEYLYLPNTLLKSQLMDINLNKEDYFAFIDFNLDCDFINESLLHFKYIEKNIGIKEEITNKYAFTKTDDIKNVIFHSSNYNQVIENEHYKFRIYQLNNFKTKVSVIIPVFNVEDFLEECLESVINQTLKDIEIICVNDGSYDTSLDMLKKYMEKDPRIKIISQFNRGPGGARNAGIDIAQGKYIYFIDSDDTIELNGLKEMYQQAEMKNLDMLKFNLMTFEDETRKNKALYQRVKPAFLQKLGDIIFDYETIGSDVFTLSPNMQSSFFKRKTVQNIRFPENIIFEDNIYLIEALFNSKRVYYYDKFLSNKRERKDSITKSVGRNFPDIIEIRNQIVDLAKKYDFYEDYRFTIYSRKYMFIKLLFMQTTEHYKQQFFEKIKEDCLNKKEEYENEGIFDILDEKSIKIFNAGLNSKDYKEFEEQIRNA